MVTLPKAIDYTKVRGSFSSVGTPPRFLVQPTYSYDPTKQDWNAKTHYPIGKLETGTYRLLGNRCGRNFLQRISKSVVHSTMPIPITRHSTRKSPYLPAIRLFMCKPVMYAISVSRGYSLTDIHGATSDGTVISLSPGIKAKLWSWLRTMCIPKPEKSSTKTALN